MWSFRKSFAAKSLLPKILLGLGCLLTVPEVAYAQSGFTELRHGNYGHGSLSTGELVGWSYRVPGNAWGVFTLKNTGRTSDLDLYVFVLDRNSQLVEVSKGIQNGTSTELVVTDITNSAKYFYIVVKNNGRSLSQYRLHADYVDPVNRFFQVLAEEAVSGAISSGQNAAATENIDRGVTVLSSALQGNSFGGVARDALIRELTYNINSQLGGNWWSRFLIEWGASIVSGFYEDYP